MQRSERHICLDGVPLAVEVDRLEIDLHCPGLTPVDHPSYAAQKVCADGAAWQPLMTYHDGTTVYLHCPAEGEDGPLGYHVDGPRAHHWAIRLSTTGGERVAVVALELEPEVAIRRAAPAARASQRG